MVEHVAFTYANTFLSIRKFIIYLSSFQLHFSTKSIMKGYKMPAFVCCVTPPAPAVVTSYFRHHSEYN